MLSFPVAEKLMNTFVFSRIDYCIALLAGVSKATLNKLQVMQYSKTRIGESLHWLPLRFRVDFKILMLTYKALHALTPQYLSELLIPYTPRRNLHSTDTGLRIVQSIRLRSMVIGLLLL